MTKSGGWRLFAKVWAIYGPRKMCCIFQVKFLKKICAVIEPGYFSFSFQSEAGRFGHWLRAEAQELSPYGKIFYGKQKLQPEGEESVPETPILSVPILLKH